MWEEGSMDDLSSRIWLEILNSSCTINGHDLCKLSAKTGDAPKKDILGWEKEIEMYNIEYGPSSMSIVPWYVVL